MVPQFDRAEPISIKEKGTCVSVEPEQLGLLAGRFCVYFHKGDIRTLLETVNSMLSEMRESFKGATPDEDRHR